MPPWVDPGWFWGCVAIGFGLGFLVPGTLALALSIPAGFLWTAYYRKRKGF